MVLQPRQGGMTVEVITNSFSEFFKVTIEISLLHNMCLCSRQSYFPVFVSTNCNFPCFNNMLKGTECNEKSSFSLCADDDRQMIFFDILISPNCHRTDIVPFYYLPFKPVLYRETFFTNKRAILLQCSFLFPVLWKKPK